MFTTSIDLLYTVATISDLDVGYIVAISLCGAVTLVVLISYIESVVFLMRNLGNWKPRDKAIWLLGLYPVSLGVYYGKFSSW